MNIAALKLASKLQIDLFFTLSNVNHHWQQIDDEESAKGAHVRQKGAYVRVKESELQVDKYECPACK